MLGEDCMARLPQRGQRLTKVRNNLAASDRCRKIWNITKFIGNALYAFNERTKSPAKALWSKLLLLPQPCGYDDLTFTVEGNDGDFFSGPHGRPEQ